MELVLPLLKRWLLSQLKLTPERTRFLETRGNAIVLGGPGSGKTTIALVKADQEIQLHRLKPGQKILFLSFARSTIARVTEHSRSLIESEKRKSLEINTYHGFTWNLLKSHGYLLSSKRKISIISPSEIADQLAHLNEEEKDRELRRRFAEEGKIAFDLFAEMAGSLLARSKSLQKIVCHRYPIIIVDEFQDTNPSEWALIKCLAEKSRIIALADAEQRIYDFRGADPARIGDFIRDLRPDQFDFGSENNRSSGTDITQYGNDLLAGSNIGKTYQNVTLRKYSLYYNRDLLYPLKGRVIQRISQLKKEVAGKWSIAVLVPSKRLMLDVSDYFSVEDDGLPVLHHDVAIDAEGPTLAGHAIAGLMQGDSSAIQIQRRLIADLVSHLRGRRGSDGPTQADLKMADGLTNFLTTGKLVGSARKRIADGALKIAEIRVNWRFSGDPESDWVSMRNLIEIERETQQFAELANDAKYIRLLRKGAMLRNKLSEMWRLKKRYFDAIAVVRDAFQQEYMMTSAKVDWSGIHVMTIHKSKGKEFDEVIVFEGYHSGKIVRSGATTSDIEQAKLALRVAVTRARRNTTIMTPLVGSCPLL